MEKQQIDGYEVILVNDGSTDGSREIAEKFCKRNKNFTLINKINSGLPDARNVGLLQAKGEYIFFLDSDDYIKNTYDLNECCNYAIYNKLDVLMFDAKAFREQGSEWEGKEHYYERGDHIKEKELLSGIEFIEKYFGQGQYRVAVYLYILRREFLIKNNLYELKALKTDQDNEFTFRLLLNAINTEYINKQIVCRRVRNNSLSIGKISKEKCKCILYVLYNDMQTVQNFLHKITTRQKIVLNAVILSDFRDVIYKCVRLERGEAQKYVDFAIRKFIYKYYNEFNKQLSIDYINFIFKVIQMLKQNKLSIKVLEDKIKEIYIIDGNENLVDYLKCKQCFNIKNILSKFQLYKKNRCIGIYGIGSYTKEFIKFYEKYIDEIKCDIKYIDTKKESYTDKFLNKDIINVKDILLEKFEEIIICSMYDSEIEEIIRKYDSNVKILKLNNNNATSLFVRGISL